MSGEHDLAYDVRRESAVEYGGHSSRKGSPCEEQRVSSPPRGSAGSEDLPKSTSFMHPHARSPLTIRQSVHCGCVFVSRGIRSGVKVLETDLGEAESTRKVVAVDRRDGVDGEGHDSGHELEVIILTRPNQLEFGNFLTRMSLP